MFFHDVCNPYTHFVVIFYVIYLILWFIYVEYCVNFCPLKIIFAPEPILSWFPGKKREDLGKNLEENLPQHCGGKTWKKFWKPGKIREENNTKV